ncbi:MAG: hypothetical protein H0V67_12265 [Geodermatophilaceae bacterium]|nr:hypothetical protein [Geodermatophilaceae bacterium]
MPTHNQHVEDVEWGTLVQSLRRSHDSQAPLDAQIAGWLVGRLETRLDLAQDRWGRFLDREGLRALVDREDVQTLRRLTDTSYPFAVVAREESSLLCAQTVHVGQADR